MIPLPWKQSSTNELHEQVLIASVTRLRLARWRDVPGLLRTALRLRRHFGHSAGGVGVGLAAQPLRRTFWTLTVWRDEAALLAYVRTPEHARAMRAFRHGLVDTTSARWPTDRRPTWDEARRMVDGDRVAG